VYLGQNNGFAGSTSMLTYNNDLTDNDWSKFAAPGFHSAFGLIGDLDGDGTRELALGSLFSNSTPGPRPGTVELFYGGTDEVSRGRSVADARFQSGGSGNLGPAFVGDIDGDGFNDLVIYDTNAGSASQLTLLH
jgi:hypothetical protein